MSRYSFHDEDIDRIFHDVDIDRIFHDVVIDRIFHDVVIDRIFHDVVIDRIFHDVDRDDEVGIVGSVLWYPKFNGRHFGLPHSSAHRIIGLGENIVYIM